MMTQDTRVFFAAERTLLAWVRSGVALLAIGFVVTKFGLFLKLFIAGQQKHVQFTQFQTILGVEVSNISGISLVIIGVVIILCAHYNHQDYINTLPKNDVPALPIRRLSSFMTYSVALVGLILAIYLAFL